MCPLALRARPSNDRLTPTKAVTTRATSKAPRHTAGKTMAAALTTPATPNPRGSRDTLLRVAGTPNPPAETTTTANQALRTTCQPAPGGYSGYGQGGYGSAGTSVTLQLDDGSGRTYQLREGSNIIGRGQDAQFRLPDTGVSRRHLEIRWDGQVA